MAKNIEIKARVPSEQWETLRDAAQTLATSNPEILVQTDTFFQCQSGRLKLREFDDGSAELIAYHRPDQSGPKTSDYVRTPCDGAQLKLALTRSLGVIDVVKKRRELLLIGQTRVHLDEVESLGTFLELEVVLTDEQSETEGTQIAYELMERLSVDPVTLIDVAYTDLQKEIRKTTA